MMIDFYAEWCPPCKELDLRFFSRSDVRELMKELVPVRVDATFLAETSAKTAIKKYNVMGWPTIIFVAPDGKILKELTVMSYNPELLLGNIRRALQLKVK